MYVSSTRMIWLITLVILGGIAVPTQPDIVEPGPTSGIVLTEQPGLLITNCRLHTQKVFIRFHPLTMCKKHTSSTAQMTSWAGIRWNTEVIAHAEADITHMLTQLQKFTITQSELSGIHRREKRFIGALLTAASALGSLFSIGVSTVNAINIGAIKRHIGELQAEIPAIQAQMDKQRDQLQTIGQTVQGTVLVLNTHSEMLRKTLGTVNTLLSVLQVDYAHTQLVSMLMSDMLRDISSSIDSLAMGKIPPYLVPLSLVQEILATKTRDAVTPLQAHLAYTLGSAVPIYVDPVAREAAFIMNLPIVTVDNIYRLKNVINVGSWQGETHVKVHTPEVVAYHDSNPELYLVPNLRMCTLTKDIHYLCPSKPFVRDNTGGICGLKSMTKETQCPTTVMSRHQVTETQAEIVGSRWLINTPATTATLAYDRHDTSSRVELPDQTFWVSVPEGAILHIDDLALYHLNADQYESEIEISDFFDERTLELNSQTVTQIQYEGMQTIDVGPVDAVLKEIASQTKAPHQPLSYSWSTPDMVLAATIGLGYILIFGIAFLYAKRTKALQCKLNKQNEKWSKILKRLKPTRAAKDLETVEEETELEEGNETQGPAILELLTF